MYLTLFRGISIHLLVIAIIMRRLVSLSSHLHHKLPRLLMDKPLSPTNSIVLDDINTNYVKNVLRMKPDSLVRAFNAKDGEFLASVSYTASKRTSTASILIKEQLRTPEQETKPRLKLYFAPIKKDKLKLMFEKATELGVYDLLPITTQNTNADFNQGGLIESLTNVLVQSTEQCERLSVPKLGSLQPISTFLSNIKVNAHTSDLIFVCKERAIDSNDAKPIWIVLEEYSGNWQSISSISLFVGPEGGFTNKEFEALRTAGCEFISLGSNVLRSETASLSVLSVLSAWMDAQRSQLL